MLLSHLIPQLDIQAVHGPTDRKIRGVSHDSREVGPDDVFVAIRGARHDGRRFVRGLLAAAVIADGDVDAPAGLTVIRVADARIALATTAAALQGNPGRQVPVVGITGTNGKTTTAWLLESIALADGGTAAVIGTTGHRIAGRPVPAGHTTPEAPVIQDLLAQARDEGCRLVAMEVSSIGLALHRADAIPYRVAAFTSFSRDHLDFHADMDAYLAAKRRLFTDLVAPGGTAVLNGDDPASATLRPRAARIWTYGRRPDADIAVLSESAQITGTRARIRTPRGETDLQLRLPGLFNLDNALAALGSALALDIDLDAAAHGLAALPSVPGRLERIDNDRGIHVFVDYAHTPDALEHVSSTLLSLAPGQLHTVFGCGGDRDHGKRPMMGRVAERHADRVTVTSDNPRTEDPGAIIDAIVEGLANPCTITPDRAEAIADAIAQARTGDVVLIAGKGHETTQTIGDQVLHFDDREVARDALQTRGGALRTRGGR